MSWMRYLQMPLSEFSVRNAKTRVKPYKLADSGDLYLAIQPSGSNVWRLRYRFAEKEKTLSFGQYPLVSIAGARRQRDDAKRQLFAGNDPSMQKKLDRIAATTAARTTFGLIAEEYVHRMKSNDAADRTIVKTEWLLLDLAKPLAMRPIKEMRDFDSSESLDNHLTAQWSNRSPGSALTRHQTTAHSGWPLAACVRNTGGEPGGT